MICDSNFGRRWKREYVVTVTVIIAFLASMVFCTEFGYYLLDSLDTWMNNFSLVWVVMCEFLGATMIYRYKDVVGLLGWLSYGVYTAAYLLALILGVAVGHSVHPGAGAGVGFGIFFVGLGAAVLLAKRPQHTGMYPPHFWRKSVLLEKLYYLAFYQVSIVRNLSYISNANTVQGCQLSIDLNIVVAAGKNWNIPIFWGPLLRYISVPILAIILGFSYPTFNAVRMDPLHIIGFTIANFTMVFVAIGFIFPRFYHPWVPVEKRGEGHIPFSPNVPTAVVDVSVGRVVEDGVMDHTGPVEPPPDYKESTMSK